MSLNRAISNKSTLAGTIASGITKAATEPLLTGTLLYLLTRGPSNLRERLLALPLSPTNPASLATLLTLLKVLTTAGVFRRANQALNRLAWNNWTLGNNGAAWSFGPSRRVRVRDGEGFFGARARGGHRRCVVSCRAGEAGGGGFLQGGFGGYGGVGGVV